MTLLLFKILATPLDEATEFQNLPPPQKWGDHVFGSQ